MTTLDMLQVFQRLHQAAGTHPKQLDYMSALHDANVLRRSKFLVLYETALAECIRELSAAFERTLDALDACTLRVSIDGGHIRCRISAEAAAMYARSDETYAAHAVLPLRIQLQEHFLPFRITLEGTTLSAGW